MSNFLTDFYKTIEVEKEKEKLLPSDDKNISEKVENQDLSMVESALDPVLSISNKFVGSAVQILDLPFMLLDAVDSGKDFVFKKMASASGMSEADQNDIIEKSKLPVEVEKFRPGKFINDNILNDAANYEAKTNVGKFAGTAGEYMPFGLLAKTSKAKNVLMGTGAVSGLIDETATQTLQSEGAGTAVGIGTNVILDLLALRKGNLAGVIDNVLPDQKTIKNAKQIQKDAKKYGLDITTGEATESASILKLEGSTNANLIGNKVLDAHWKNRPQQLKNYITNWGKANGLIPDTGKITSSSINEQVKKVALQLDQQRSKMWLKSGGEKFNKSFFDSQSVDNIKIELLKVAENAPEEIAKYLTRQANAIGKSNGKGSVLNKIYQDLRDGGIQSAKGENFTAAKSFEEAKNVLKNLLVTNKNWVSANKKYKVFSETFEKPLSKGSVTELFNDLKKGKWIESSKTNANIYKYITSPNVRPIDIEKLATAVNKSGVKGAWENIASDFFNNAFNKAAIDNMNRGLNTGNNFYNAILKTPRNKENFTEVMYQLALTTNKNVKKTDVKNAVTSFANVLKASGAGGKVGSTTATNIGAKEQLSKTPLDVIEGFALTGIKKWFGERAYSKSSQEIAEALVSKNGIDAFIDLAQNWKNKNKAVSLIRALTIATDEVE
tara:strand:- start:2932 stop:4929 length:1998 start_codon:yes stop_codon:yes gene_type:complete